MIKEHFSLLRRSMVFFDMCVIACAAVVGYYLRDNIGPLYPYADYLMLLPVYLFIWAMALKFFEVYQSFRVKPMLDNIWGVWKASVVTFVVFASLAQIFKLTYLSRSLIIITTVVAWGFLSLEKITLIHFFRFIRRQGLNYRNILLVGTGPRAQRFIEIIEINKEWGLKIIGLVDEDPALKGTEVKGYKVIGTFNDIPDIVHNNVVDEVAFVVPRSWMDRIEVIMHFCEVEGVKIHVAVDHFELKFYRAHQSDMGGFPLISFETGADRLLGLVVKRFFDIIVSGLALIVLSPLFLITAILIKFTSPGPVFFRQERSGLSGRKFILYKFRTMVANAEEQKDGLLHHNEMSGPVFKITNDPRVTPLGKYLRKLSIDELPQFWNVFSGDMSIVGPRPPLPSEVADYDNWHRRRLSMRPGITCIWQVSGRNKIADFNRWVALDLEYIDNWSLGLDIKIFFKTFPVVLFGIGAK
jgi:exopolysaccharide biosynthesis polyprenyl glycosylphosphotransferase